MTVGFLASLRICSEINILRLVNLTSSKRRFCLFLNGEGLANQCIAKSRCHQDFSTTQSFKSWDEMNKQNVLSDAILFTNF